MNAENSLFLPQNFRLQKNADGFLGLQAGSYGSFALKLPDSPPLKNQPLAKALGLSKRRRTESRRTTAAAVSAAETTVFDVTAGWGKDACLIALLGFRVRAFEKDGGGGPPFKRGACKTAAPKNFSSSHIRRQFARAVPPSGEAGHNLYGSLFRAEKVFERQTGPHSKSSLPGEPAEGKGGKEVAGAPKGGGFSGACRGGGRGNPKRRGECRKNNVF